MPDTNATMFPPAVAIMGPTASGKTQLAIDLVKKFPFEIISVDSVMVYRQMDIGSAKPSASELKDAPHRLIDFLPPNQAYSAAQFQDDALAAMKEITEAGKIPLLVGGTMLYYKALFHGLSELPSANEEIRHKLEQEMAQQGLPFLHQRLQQVDPEAAARIHPNDPQRIMRALEVFELTGKAMTQLQREQMRRQQFPYCVVKIAVSPAERKVLHQRIERRFRQMMEQGLVDEVKALMARGDLDESMPAVRAVGYRQVWDFLHGRMDYTETIDRGIFATRQLAKRQLTWLRSEDEVNWLDSMQPNLLQQCLKLLRESPCMPEGLF